MALSAGDPPTPVADPVVEPVADPKVEERKFTQEELDRIVQERVARVKREAPDDYADLKKAAEELAEIKKSQMSELETLQAEKDAALLRATEVETRANQRLIQAEILAEATIQKAMKPEHLHKLLDLDSVTIGDDGQVSGIQEAVTSFLEANPEYVGKAKRSDPVDQGARGTTPTQLGREDLKSMSPEKINEARAAGRLDDLLGVTKS